MMTATSWWVGPAAAFAPPTYRAPADPFRVPGAADAEPATIRLAHGRVALQKRNHPLALRCFEDAARLAPDLAIAHLSRALCLAEMGRGDEAAEALLDAIDLPDVDGTVSLHVARMVAKEGDTRAAMELLARAFDIAPTLIPTVAEDRAFASLADHPEFLQMVGRL